MSNRKFIGFLQINMKHLLYVYSDSFLHTR